MTFKELFAQDPFSKICNEVSIFTERKLEQYILDLKTTDISKTECKEIFDAVWGNIEFSGGEIAILDSPLLQRLRKIKQLGLAYYVYCGCDYSRYYHTLGVVFLADRMATAINNCKFASEKKEYFKAVVRLAAIFHDVGHMFMSHVSEHFFGKSVLYPRNPQVEKMLVEFERKAGKKTALHELLSCMIVNTDAVRRLLKVTIPEIVGFNRQSSDEDIHRVVEYISSLIVGVPVDAEVLPYVSIINGPIDADKCDYLSRDSHVTRVPVAVDISRLTQKLSIVSVDDINMSGLWHEDANNDIQKYELAMQDSAEKALFQLCIARTIMFDSVYYHHKVLTAETECRNLIAVLSNLDNRVFATFDEILEYTDEDFTQYFFESLKSKSKDSDKQKIDEVKNAFIKLYNRCFAKRVACIMPDYLEGKQIYKESFFDNVITQIDSEEERKVIDEIKQEYIGIKKQLENVDVKYDKLNIFILQAPSQIFWHSKIQVPIDLRNGKKRDFRGYELVSSRETSSSSSYIVTDEKDRLLVCLALEKVLYKLYRIQLLDGSLTCGKYQKEDIDKRRKELFYKGYYDDAPQLISDNLLYAYLPKRKVLEIVEHFKTYEGVEGYQINESNVRQFFKQILAACRDKETCHAVVKGVECLLRKTIFFNRECIVENIKQIVAKSGKKEIDVVPLGKLLDSAAHMSYFWNDVKSPGTKITLHEDLEEFLKKSKAECITFFDDGSYSGTQLISIMQEYMGIKNRKTEEEHVKSLNETYKKRLMKKKIMFFFCAFNKSKETEIRDELREIGLDNVEFVFEYDLSRKCFDKDQGIFEDEEQRSIVKEVLADIGKTLLTGQKRAKGKYKKNWDRKRVEKAALGYNDAQQMVVLKSSVPTYTITAFWAEGTYNGYEWKPLFKRTSK